MQRRLWPSGVVFLAGVLLGCSLYAPAARGQEDEKPAPKEAATRPADDSLPGEVFPKVLYLKDAEGNLQAVLGMPYEQIIEAWKHERQLAQQAQPPSYSIQSLDISGTSAGATAELVARVRVTVHEDGWVGVPLRFNSAELREEPEYQGPGEHVLHVDPQNQGYVVWIRGPENESHEISLKMLLNVERVGPQSRLEVTVPRAAVSQFQLHVPVANALAEVSEGSTLDSVRALAGGKTELKVIGLAGDFELGWHPAESQVASLPTILEVTAAQLIRMNGRSINTEAKLTVRSLGKEFDHFQVRLPRGADYIGPTEAGVSLVAVDVSSPGGKLYDVKLDKSTVGPVDVRLVTERVHNAEQGDEMLELAGFEVPKAVRQWGTIGVQVEGNWQVVWGDANHVRSVDDVVAMRALSTLLGAATSPDRPAGAAAAEVAQRDLVAGFEYFVQPYSLAARVEPQGTRVRVEPQYTVTVGDDEAHLQARLKYTILGAKVRSLAFELPGWELDAVGPATLVDVDTAMTAREPLTAIPLVEATSGEVELTLEASRKLEGDADEIALELPRTADEASAQVIILSDDNIELIPRLDDTRDLESQPLRPGNQLPERQQDPLVYRATGPAPRFVADRKVHEQSISTAMATSLAVGADQTQVEQTFRYHVAYQPTDHFTLIVPRGVRRESLTILHEGQPLASPPALVQRNDESNAPMRVNLPAPTIGRCQLQLRYVLAHERPPQQASTLVTVTLVVPAEGELTDNQLTVSTAPEISVTYPQGAWSAAGRASTSEGGVELSLTADRAIPEVTLAVSSKQNPNRNQVTVHRALVQTHLTNSVRQDRVLLRLSANQPAIELTLPSAADPRSLLLAIDGRRVVPESIRQRTVTFSLADGPGEYLVELRYHFPDRPPQGELALEGPQLRSARWVEQLYWELTVPAGEHVVFAPEGYVEEQRWTWANYLWQRQPSLDRKGLERWIGLPADVVPGGSATSDNNPAEASAANRYLFSTVGRVEPLSVYTMSRARLVLLASLPLLAIGLVLIYVPWARHPAVLLLAGVALVGASIVAPQTALLLGQASVLGLLLAGVAALLARLAPQRPAVTPAPSSGSSYAPVERSITELYHRAPSGGSRPASTSTDPLVPTSGEPQP